MPCLRRGAEPGFTQENTDCQAGATLVPLYPGAYLRFAFLPILPGFSFFWALDFAFVYKHMLGLPQNRSVAGGRRGGEVSVSR